MGNGSIVPRQERFYIKHALCCIPTPTFDTSSDPWSGSCKNVAVPAGATCRTQTITLSPGGREEGAKFGEE
jgi:hypothetical protein